MLRLVTSRDEVPIQPGLVNFDTGLGDGYITLGAFDMLGILQIGRFRAGRLSGIGLPIL